MLIGLETFIILSEEQTNFDTSSAGHWTSSYHPVLYCTLYEAGVYIISSFFLSLSQRQTYILGREEAPEHFFRRTAITSPDCQEFMV